jgi:hypothetical protein
MENKHQFVGLFLDLTKAYDVLNHQITLINQKHMELEVFQINGSMLFVR